jgi:hypothetical protein
MLLAELERSGVEADGLAGAGGTGVEPVGDTVVQADRDRLAILVDSGRPAAVAFWVLSNSVKLFVS